MRICDKCIHDKVCLLSKSRASCELFDEYRPHGEWTKRSDGFYKCPFCCYSDRSTSNFCPNCGADMREGDGE